MRMRGHGDTEMRGRGDTGSQGCRDTETRGHGDKGTWGRGDVGTRGRGDEGTQAAVTRRDKRGSWGRMWVWVPPQAHGGGPHGQLPQLGDTGGGDSRGGPHRAALLALAADDAQLDLQRRHLLPLHLPLQLGNPRALAALLVAGAWGGDRATMSPRGTRGREDIAKRVWGAEGAALQP